MVLYWYCFNGLQTGFFSGCIPGTNDEPFQESHTIILDVFIHVDMICHIHSYVPCLQSIYIYIIFFYIYTHTYMHACMHAYTHTYIHTYHYIALHYIALHCITLHYIMYIYIIHTIYTCIYICMWLCIYIYTCSQWDIKYNTLAYHTISHNI